VKLQVGLFHCSPGWTSLLKQIGVPFNNIADDFQNDDYAVIVVGEELDLADKKRLHTYAKSGGSLLLNSLAYNFIFGNEICVRQLSFILPDDNSIFRDVGLLDIFSQCTIPIISNELNTVEQKPSAFVGRWNEANIIVFPFDMGKLLNDNRTLDKSFYSPHTRLPFEQVALVSKNSLRWLAATSLEYLFHQQNLPCVKKWNFPPEAQSVFAFRIDTDYANRDEIKKLYALSQKHQLPFTWFVDVKSQQELLPYYAEMKEQEIGIHCFEHQTYDDYQSNYDNVLKAKQLFESNKLDAKGFAAPYGKWNRELGRAIQDLGFEYSSEFSYDYDNLPSYPLLGTEESRVLQVPIHPISIGTLKRLGYSDEDMIEYFRFVIEQKYYAREPILLYHHPKDGHEKVLEWIFETITNMNIPSLRFIEFVNWWKKRVATELNIELDGNVLRLDSSENMNDCSLKITPNNGTEYFCQVQSVINMDEVQWRSTPKAKPLPDDYLRIRKFNPWISFIHLQDRVVGKLKRK